MTDLDRLVDQWRAYIAAHPATDQTTSGAAYIRGLKVCADQLAGALERMRDDE